MKTTKRTAIARGHNNLKQGRQGQCHTMSIAGCIRIRLSWPEVSANDKSPRRARRGTVSPTSHSSCKCPRNITLWEWRFRDTQESGKLTKYVRNDAQENRNTENWRRPTKSDVRWYRWSHRNSPRAPTGPNARGDTPPQKRNAHQWRKPSAKTRRKIGDNATGSINKTDAKKRRRARSGHSQRASAKPTTEADKATTKKERGMEWVSDSDRASNWGTNARKVTDPWRGRTKQRGKNSRWLAASGRIRASAPAAPGSQENRQEEAEASPEGEVSNLKDNPLTGGRAGQVDLEADLRSGEHNGENKEPPKTRSLREDHPERGHQRLQGAKLSHRTRHQPQPAEMRVGYQRQPQTPSKGRGGNTEP